MRKAACVRRTGSGVGSGRISAVWAHTRLARAADLVFAFLAQHRAGRWRRPLFRTQQPCWGAKKRNTACIIFCLE